MFRTLSLCAVALLVLAGCDDASPTGLPPVLDIEEVEFAASFGVDLADFTRTDTDLHWKTEEEGEGDPVGAGEPVWVHYWGWLPDGFLFDTSEGGIPLDFVIGESGIIPGFSQGVEGMRMGETRMVLMPPHLAYGAQGAGGGVIPPNSWLVFRIILVEEPNEEGE